MAIKAIEVVLVDDLGLKDVEGKLHILKMRHGGVVEKLLDVKGKEACIYRGQGAVDQDI